MNDIAEYFNSRADQWAKDVQPTTPAQLIVPSIAGLSNESRVLDVGCGTGVMAPIYLANNVRSVVALDVASRMIEHARETYADEPTLRFECCDVYDFEDEEGFDAFVIYNAYPHFLNKKQLVEKAASLLRPNGRFVVIHSMSRERVNACHHSVPDHVRCSLRSAKDEAAEWKDRFLIDTIVDAPSFYCFAGTVLEA